MSRPKPVSRRSFVKSAAAVAAPCLIPASALGLDGKTPPSERVALGCIGVGGRGTYDMRQLLKYGGQVVAVCDVRQTARAAAAALAKIPLTAAHHDFRELLARRDVDAVLIATPDHWHVPIALAALRAGKDVYVEKPLGISIDQGKALRKAVLAGDRVFMHGTEQRAMGDVRRVVELVRTGRLGALHTITVACPGGEVVPAQPDMPVPAGFDYEMWLGPAPRRPYTEKRCTQPFFFFISDYAPSGFVAGWGIHHLDIAQWALDADASGPVEVQGTATFPPKGSLSDTPLTWRIEYKYANGVRMIFTDASQNPEGIKFEGAEGSIFKAYRQDAKAQPASLLTSAGVGQVGNLSQTLYVEPENSDDHCFLACVKSRRPTCSPIEAAHRSTTVACLGHIALVLGRKLRWDPAAEHFVNDPEADALLSRPMREPWTL